MVILGFGKTEEDTALKIINECLQAIQGLQENEKETDSVVRAIAAEYHDDDERYRKMKRDEAPERYTYFWPYSYRLYDGRYIVEFVMHHINRRHAFSPDGWALLVTRWVLSIHSKNEYHIFREV